jgi:hypothetical protein
VDDAEVKKIDLLVVALGRSGTMSAARFYGLGHESDFNEKGISTDRACYDGEWNVSTPEPGGNHIVLPRRVIHQVRHPLDAIASHTTCHQHTFRFLSRYILLPKGDNLLLSLHAWVNWNMQLERGGGELIRVESVEGMPRLNERSHRKLKWGDLWKADSTKSAEAVQLAREYGYEV